MSRAIGCAASPLTWNFVQWQQLQSHWVFSSGVIPDTAICLWITTQCFIVQTDVNWNDSSDAKPYHASGLVLHNELLGYKDTVTICTQTELSVLYLLYNVTHCFVTKGNSIVIEVLNVAKSLFFRNVFHEKLIGKRKPYWCTCLFWKVYIPHHPEGASPSFP